MSECDYQIVCPFYRRRIPIHDVMYQQHVQRYCKGTSDDCAILLVMKNASFLKVPKDLYPNQKWRVDDILASSNPLGGPK